MSADEDLRSFCSCVQCSQRARSERKNETVHRHSLGIPLMLSCTQSAVSASIVCVKSTLKIQFLIFCYL